MNGFMSVDVVVWWTSPPLARYSKRIVALAYRLCNVCASKFTEGSSGDGAKDSAVRWRRKRTAIAQCIILDRRQPSRSSTSRMRWATSDSLRFLLIAMLRSF